MVTVLSWWIFVALAPAAYWLAPQRWRNWLLALSSMAFLGFHAPYDVALMLVIAVAIYAAFQLEGGKTPSYRTPVIVILMVGYLFWSKYLPAFAAAFNAQAGAPPLVIPLGVSYFCFKLIHYAIERGRGNFPVHTLADFAGFLFLMPIFSAGPIERFEHYLGHRQSTFQFDFIIEGVTRIIQGLVKKFVVCIVLAEAIQRVAGGDGVALVARLDGISPPEVWAFLYLSLAYAYFDFSAYSDIAIGASRLFGLRIMENFNYPFLATSLRDFWLRWHMTLATWCRTYIYMGMIGWTRNPYVAVIATFAVMGLWHAGWPLNWFAWGLWHGTGMIVVLVWARYAQKRRIGFFKSTAGQVVGWALTMTYVALGGAFTTLHAKAPFYDSVRLIAKALAISI